MSRGRAGRLWTLAPAALAPEVSIRCRSMASTSCDSISAGGTRLRQASSCICRRLGRLPKRHAFGSSLVAPESPPRVATSASSRNHDTSVQRCNPVSSSIRSGFAAPSSTISSGVDAFCPIG